MTKESNKHYFLDEAGDTTFYGKWRISIIDHTGVSSSFTLGLLKAKDNLQVIREGIEAMVYKLYGLTPDEAKIIDPTLTDSELVLIGGGIST